MAKQENQKGQKKEDQGKNEQQQFPPQEQAPPGEERKMHPKPKSEDEEHRGSGKLQNKVALISGGDSGIGRAVAIAFAREGCDVSIIYLNEDKDAEETKRQVEEEGRKALLLKGDIGSEQFCIDCVERTVAEYGKLDVLVNNAAEQHPQENFEDITEDQLIKTFRTNIFSMFFLTKAALKYLKKDNCIINTTSVTAYKGSPGLIDYSSTKGAIVSFTRSLSQKLIEKGIRVNAVAPGPIWTPLIVSTMPEHVEDFGKDTPMKRAGQPEEVASCYVFLASNDSSYMAGQVLHPNGGQVLNG